MSKSNKQKIRVLVIEPCKAPYAAEIPNELQSLQHQVGGRIQALYAFEDSAIIANDEGKLLGLPWNRPLYDADGNMYDVIAGTFLIVGLTEDDFGALTEEQVKRYTAMF